MCVYVDYMMYNMVCIVQYKEQITFNITYIFVILHKQYNMIAVIQSLLYLNGKKYNETAWNGFE